jgi:GT2 family glycosyltransferase
MSVPHDSGCSIIILNYNGRHLLEKCLQSVLSQEYPSFEVLLVDNASQDDSVSFVQSRFPSVRIVRSDTNLGFAGGNNLGVRHSREALVVLLNNDTVVKRGWLRGLVEAVGGPDVAIASSLVITEGIPERYYEKNGSINFLGHNIMRVFENSRDIFYAGGASLIYKKELLGLPFDEEYFAYGEDVYLGLRARFMGYRVVHTNESRVDHLGGGTSGNQFTRRLQMLQERNRLMNTLLFFSMPTLFRLVPLFLANFVGKCAAGIVAQHYSLLSTLWAHFEIVARTPWLIRKRKLLRDDFRVSEGEVISRMSGRITQGESIVGRALDNFALLYHKIVGLKTIELT